MTMMMVMVEAKSRKVPCNNLNIKKAAKKQYVIQADLAMLGNIQPNSFKPSVMIVISTLHIVVDVAVVVVDLQLSHRATR